MSQQVMEKYLSLLRARKHLLDAEDYEVVAMRFGVDRPENGKTMRQVAEALGLTVQDVIEIEDRVYKTVMGDWRGN